MNDRIVSNEEIVDLINIKLLKLQNDLFNNDNEIKKVGTIKIIKIIKNVFLCLCIIFIGLVILDYKMIYVVILGFFVVCLIINFILINKIKNANTCINKENAIKNKEAIILQDTRNYINGKTSLNNAIEEKLNILINEIIKNR